MARQTIDDSVNTINNRVYLTVGEVIKGLEEIGNLSGQITDNGRLGRAVFRILGAAELTNEWQQYLGNPKGLVELINGWIKDGTLGEKTKIAEVKEKKGDLSETSEKVAQGKTPETLKDLKDEYEAWLAENENKPEKASAFQSERHNAKVKMFIAKQQEFYRENLQSLKAKGVSESQAKIVAEKNCL